MRLNSCLRISSSGINEQPCYTSASIAMREQRKDLSFTTPLCQVGTYDLAVPIDLQPALFVPRLGSLEDHVPPWQDQHDGRLARIVEGKPNRKRTVVRVVLSPGGDADGDHAGEGEEQLGATIVEDWRGQHGRGRRGERTELVDRGVERVAGAQDGLDVSCDEVRCGVLQWVSYAGTGGVLTCLTCWRRLARSDAIQAKDRIGSCFSLMVSFGDLAQEERPLARNGHSSPAASTSAPLQPLTPIDDHFYNCFRTGEFADVHLSCLFVRGVPPCQRARAHKLRTAPGWHADRLCPTLHHHRSFSLSRAAPPRETIRNRSFGSQHSSLLA